jgi:hypothetical protein
LCGNFFHGHCRKILSRNRHRCRVLASACR